MVKPLDQIRLTNIQKIEDEEEENNQDNEMTDIVADLVDMDMDDLIQVDDEAGYAMPMLGGLAFRGKPQ